MTYPGIGDGCVVVSADDPEVGAEDDAIGA